jgi:hypothetical protein
VRERGGAGPCRAEGGFRGYKVAVCVALYIHILEIRISRKSFLHMLISITQNYFKHAGFRSSAVHVLFFEAYTNRRLFFKEDINFVFLFLGHINR